MKRKLLSLVLSAFSLMVSAADTYTPLQWIDYTGGDVNFTNYFDTGYMPVSSTKVEMACLGYSGYENRWRAIFSGRTAPDNGFSIYLNNRGDQFGYFVGGYTNDYVGSFSVNTIYRIVADKNRMLVNGIEVAATNRPDENYMGQNTNNITLFSGTADWPFYGRIYYFNIYEGETLKHRFVPVLKNGNTPCFHCTVCNDYKEPHGSGFGYRKLTYAPVEYIEYPADGAETPVSRTFDTGYVPNQNTKVEVKFMANATGNWSAIFSGRNKEAGNGISLYKNGNNSNFGYFVGNYINDNHADFSVGTIYTATCTLANLNINGTDYSTGKNESDWVATTRSITLFSNPEKDQIFRGRIYYVKIYDGDALKHHFVPVKASDGTVGFYDIVEKKYITTRTTTDSPYFNAVGWDGSGDAIQSSFKYGGSYIAYTKLYNADYDYGAEGTSNEHYNQLVGTPETDVNSKPWYDENYTMTDWNFDGTSLPNFGNGKPADIYVRRYFVVNASLDGRNVYMPAPHDDAPCEYYINGHLILSITDGWNEDEIYVLTDEQKAYIKTDGTMNVFAYHVHQNWGGRYADGGLYVGGVPADRCADFWNLSASIPLAEAMDITEYSADVNSRQYSRFRDKLYPLRTAMRMKVLDKHDDVFSGNEPSEGDFYLYNIGTRAFFCGGSDWGAHAAIGFPGIKVTLSSQDNGFVIDTHLNNGGANEYLNHTGYCDTPSQDVWKFVSTGDNKSYFIKKANNDGQMLGWNATTKDGFSDNAGPYFDNVSAFQGNTANNDNKWILVTEAERNALMDKAALNHPVDVSYLIQSPNYNQREDISAWKFNNGDDNHDVKISGRGGRDPYYIYDAYNLSYSDIHQTVTGLRPGIYKVSSIALYRHTMAQGEDVNARLYAYQGDANDNYKASDDLNAVSLPNVNTGWGKAPGYDSNYGSHTNICNAMEMGAFMRTSVNVIVGSEGTLTFGVMKENGPAADCTYADNWRLEYLGLPNITVADTDTQAPSLTGVPANVTLGRELVAGQWNGFSVPFDVTAEQLAASALKDASIKKFSSAEGNEITLADAPSLEAGKPYLIKPESEIENPSFAGVTIPADLTEKKEGTGDYTFQAHLFSTQLPIDGSVAYVSTSDSSIKKLTSGSIKGLRSIFNIPKSSGVKALVVRFDDSTDAIATLDAEGNIVEGPIFNVAGQRMNSLRRGVNIVGGKKVVVK